MSEQDEGYIQQGRPPDYRVSTSLRFILFFLTLFLKPMGTVQAQIPYFRPHDFGQESDKGLALVAQDADGFIWLGSDDGLFRYDGLDYNRYGSSDSMTDMRVTALHCDHQNHLWVGFESGEIWFLDGQDQLVKWQPEEGLPKMRITGLLTDNQDRLWFCTYGEGLYVYDQDRLFNINKADGLADNQIYSMAMDSFGDIWLATDNGVSVCSFEDRTKSIRNLNLQDGLLDEIVYAFAADKSGMWIGFHRNGFCHYDVRMDSVDFSSSSWDYGSVTSLAVTVDQQIWVGTESSGVLHYDLLEYGRQLEFANREPLFKSMSCEQIFSDKEGNVWLIVDGNELYSGSPSLQVLSHDLGDVQAVLQDGKGHIWLGLQSGLHELVDGNIIPSRWRENIISLYEDSQGKLWIGTFGDGVICWDPASNRSRRLSEANGMANGSVLSIDGYKNKLWLATLGGVVEISNTEKALDLDRIPFRNLSEDPALSGKFFYKVFVDFDGVLWFATDGHGVIKYQADVAVNLLEADLLPVKTAYTISQDDFGNIWVGTSNDGVYIYHDSTYQHIGIEEGLRQESITSLSTDQAGEVLLIHQKGIDIYNPETETIRYLDQLAGLEALNPTLNSIAKGSNNSIWIGGQNKLIHYIANLKISQHYPNLVFKQIRMFDPSFDYRITNNFSYRNNFIEFDFIGLWYHNPADVKYQYQLEGYDLDWKVSSDRRVSYSQLAPGTYKFQVRSLLHEQVILPSQIEYAFHIKRPFWQRFWFIALMTIIIVTGIYLYQKYRERRINRNATIERERIESQYEVLKAQINPHFLFNSFNTLANIIEEDADLAIEYIEKLSDYYRSIIQFRNQKIISLEEEMVLIDDFIYLLKKRFGNNLMLIKEVDLAGRYIPPLTLQMLVENAVKHNVISAQKPLKIVISSENDDYLAVRNNLQPKKTKEPSTNFGLQNIKSRVEMLSKKKVIISTGPKEFEVFIPLINTDRL